MASCRVILYAGARILCFQHIQRALQPSNHWPPAHRNLCACEINVRCASCKRSWYKLKCIPFRHDSSNTFWSNHNVLSSQGEEPQSDGRSSDVALSFRGCWNVSYLGDIFYISGQKNPLERDRKKVHPNTLKQANQICWLPAESACNTLLTHNSSVATVFHQTRVEKNLKWCSLFCF